MRTALPVALWALCVLAAACSGSSRKAAAPRATAPAPTPVRTASAYAFPRQDVPYEQVLDEARRSNRPTLLFFWASW